MNINELIEKYKTYHANTKANLSETIFINSDEENESYYILLIAYAEVIKDLKSLVKEKAEVKTRRTYVKKVIKKDGFKYKIGDRYICTKLTGHCFATLNKVYFCVKNSNEYLSIVDDANETITIQEPETHFRKLGKNETIEEF